MKKGILISGFLFALAVSLLSLSFASAGITIVAPANFSNHTTSVMFNVSYVNVTDGVTTPLNATFYYNLSGTWTKIGSTGAAACFQYRTSCNVTLSIAGLTDGFYSINATIDNGSDQGSVGAALSLITSMVRFDSSKPIVYTSNVSTVVAAGNYSSTLVLNVSVVDAGMGVASVFFNITNSTGDQNKTYAATNEAGTNRYSVSINTAHFPDGNYNITVFANDTQLGNLNNSATVGNVRFDNSGPVLSFSCSPTSVDRDVSITCSCTATDSVSGANTPSYTAHPSTSNTGSFSTTCTSSNYARISTSSSIAYTVSQAAASSSSSSSSSSGGGSSAQSSIEYKMTIANIDAGASSTIKDIGNAYGVKEIEIKPTESVTNVKLSVIKYSGRPSAVSSDKTGKVYKYLQITATNVENKLSNARVRIQVQKSWMDSNSIAKDNLAMFKFDSNEWKELTTSFVEEDKDYNYYDINLNSFRYFAIAQKVVPEEKKDEGVAAANQPDVRASPAVNTKAYVLWGLLVLAVAGVLAGMIWYFWGRNK